MLLAQFSKESVDENIIKTSVEIPKIFVLYTIGHLKSSCTRLYVRSTHKIMT